MAIFNSYVKLPNGKTKKIRPLENSKIWPQLFARPTHLSAVSEISAVAAVAQATLARCCGCFNCSTGRCHRNWGGCNWAIELCIVNQLYQIRGIYCIYYKPTDISNILEP